MRTIAFYVTIVTLTLVFGVIIILATLVGIKAKPNGFLENLPRRWARGVLRAAGSTQHLRGAEHMSLDEQRVYVSNHVSWFDVFALASVLPRYRFVAKKELLSLPVFGKAAAQIAGIFIDRNNRKAAFEGYRAATEQIRGGVNVVVFPEGTRGPSYALRPFKKGPFVLAIAAQVPVVPTVVYGARDIQAKGGFFIHPGDVEITLLPAIPTAGMTYEDRHRLMQMTWDAMAECLQHRHGVQSPGVAVDPHNSAA